MSFGDDFKDISEKEFDRLRRVRNQAALGLFSSIVLASPVRTGTFRGNWTITLKDEFPAFDPEKAVIHPQDIVDHIKQTAGGAKMEQTIALGNNSPYGTKLEYEGWSAQVPKGMVRVNAKTWPTRLAKANKNVK